MGTGNFTGRNFLLGNENLRNDLDFQTFFKAKNNIL